MNSKVDAPKTQSYEKPPKNAPVLAANAAGLSSPSQLVDMTESVIFYPNETAGGAYLLISMQLPSPMASKLLGM